MKIHLDTDLGGDTDDLCALAMLLKWPNLQIIGITTVAEEQGRRAGYTQYALKLAGRADIPVRAGADVSLGCYRLVPGYPNEAEMWPEPVSPAPAALDAALELLKQSIEADALIVGIGPYTNFALLEQKYPGLLAQARLYLMGGYVYPPRAGFPQWGKEMDWNVQLDVVSAQATLAYADPTLIPLAVTVETGLRRAYLPALEKTDALGALLARQALVLNNAEHNDEKYGQWYAGVPDDLLNFQHDPLACAVALGWPGVKIEQLPLKAEVDEGWLVARVDPDGKPTQVVTAVDGSGFSDFWLEVVTGQH